MVQWIWGGYSVGGATLSRFYVAHFLFPMLIVAVVLSHLIFLHKKGSRNPLGVASNLLVVPFHRGFSVKDVTGFIVVAAIIVILVGFYPNDLGDPVNFVPADSLVTPSHIKPEWYFL